MIYISIGEYRVNECIKALKGLKFAEIRMDKIKDISKEGIEQIFSKPLTLIATCRPCIGYPDNKRKELLLSAIDNGASYVDIEIESSEKYKKEIIKQAKSKGCKIIISYHNYKKTPGIKELICVLKKAFKSGAEIVKIACEVKSKKDNARLLGLLDSDNPFVYKRILLIGMGKKGRITRIVAPLLGSPFTYASLSKGKETASGQFTEKEIRGIWKLFGF